MIYKEKVRVTMEKDLKADVYLGLKRPNRDALVIKPRSRSLDDLPGHIRVPVLKRPEPRLKPRLDATVAGLKELRILREKHEKLFEDAKISVGRNVEEHGDGKGSLRSIRQHSASSLGRITEEDTDEIFTSEVTSPSDIAKCTPGSSNDKLSTIDNCHHGEQPLHQIRSRRPLSLSDSSFLENELNEHGSLCRRNSWSHNRNVAEDMNTTKTGSASSLRQYDQRLTEHSLSKKINLSKTETTIKYKYSNTSFNVSQRFSASKHNLLGRSKSLSFTAINNSRAPIQSTPLNINVGEPNIRRASLQCEHVITKHTPFIPMSKFLSDLKLSYNFPGPLHAVLMQYGGQSNDSSANQNVKTDPKNVQVRRALFRVGKIEAVDDINAANKSNKSGNEPNAENNSIYQVPKFTNKITKSKSDSQLEQNIITMSSYTSPCPEKKMQGSQNQTHNVNDNEINNNCFKDIGNNEKKSATKESDIRFHDKHEENDDNVIMADQNNSFSSNFRENENCTNESKMWGKKFSLASDEGYVTSLQDISHMRSRLSIRSESSWVSSEFEFDDTTSTIDSGVILPVSQARERALRASFARSSISVMDDATSLSDNGQDLVSPSLTEKKNNLNAISNSTVVPINCDKMPKDENIVQMPNSEVVHCEQMANKSAEDEQTVLKPFLETAL